MSSVDKIIDKMKRQPNGIRPDEAEKVLNAYGYKVYVIDILNRIT